MKRAFSAAVLTVGAILLTPLVPASAASYVPVSGAGSTWSANAMDQWRRNVNQYGMRIDYQASGSSDGRNQFRNGTVDFAVSEIPYGLKDGNAVDPLPTRPFAYMPIVAGGTAFMYNLKIGPNRVTQLRLSGDTIAKMFTGVITKWDDPAVKADNPGLTLPPIKVVPVVRSDGSGTTAQFTAWLAAEHASVWNEYCKRVGRASPCGFTSNYPTAAGMVAQSGSLGVSGYVKQDQSQGAITYVEYSYAKAAGFPAAKVLNDAGFYVLPTAQAVAVGLLGARINPDLSQNLTGVYNNTDKRAYPLSSYSYMIIPTNNDNGFSNEKGNTLADFANYFLCQGQQQADALGYSPLPLNLVKAGFDQIRRIPGAVPGNINLAKCNNPTFSADGSNTLAKTAPQPPACDAKGPTQCGTAAETAGGGGASGGGNSGGGNSGGGGAAGGTTSGGATTSGGTSSGGGTAAGGGVTDVAVTDVSVDTESAVVVDPETGQVIAAETTTVDATTGEVIVDPAAGAVAGGAYVAGIPVSTEASAGWGPYTGLLVATFLVVLALLFAPPLVARYMAARRVGGDA
jgi:phosphate ABC transporter phosphate-binding protein